MAVGINSIIAIAGYSCWRVWLIKDRSTRFNIAETRVTTISEVLYTFIMMYLLLMTSHIFLVVALFSLLTHILFGLYVELFKPEQKIKEAQYEQLLSRFWSFVLVDTAITLGCFLLMINFGQ
jgi:hypothetical protein